MSRIGKQPITVPAGVEVKIGTDVVEVKNPDSSTIEFLYQVVGEGTEKIAQLKMKDTFTLAFLY